MARWGLLLGLGCLVLLTCGQRRDSHFNWGLYHFDQGRFQDAAREFALAVKGNERTAEALFNQGLSLQRMGHHREALTLYQTCLDRFGPAAHPYINMAQAHAAMGDHDQAHAHFQMAMEAAPVNHEPYVAYAFYLLAQNSADSDEKAWRIAEKAVEVGDLSSVAHYFRGRAAHRIGEHGLAQEAFRRAIALDGTNGPALGALGSYHLERKEYREAAHLLTRATVHEPRNPQYFLWLGMALRHLGQYQQALEALWQSESVDPSLPGLAEELDAVLKAMVNPGEGGEQVRIP